jgi:aconitate hydratase
MAESLTYKILKSHVVEGECTPGETIAIRIDQTLLQDATGTCAALEFEAMGVGRVRTKRSVCYVDHNMLQSGYENADDHRFLQTFSARYGLWFSRPGSGICHQVHTERFAVPGETLLGSDSHTPTGGGLGMIAIGAGGLDVAVAMAGGAFRLTAPRVVKVVLKGELGAWVTAKDVILELLRRLSVKGGVGKVMEYVGPGVQSLSVPERATITNMGAELGATTSVFPSDEVTRTWLRAQGRESDWSAQSADEGAEYDEEVELDLGGLEPLIACPHSPDNVVPVSDVAGTAVQQVCIGSCTNSSYRDLMTVAALLKGREVSSGVSLTISPGSQQVLEMVAKTGALADIIASGARVLECGCGPCIGMGQAPPSGSVTLRTFNRNFEGRSGTADAQVYLCSPGTAVAAALSGEIRDPRELGEEPSVAEPDSYDVPQGGIIGPPEDGSGVEVVKGPNIRELPRRGAAPERIEGEVLIKVGDNITTDHIMPAGAKVLPLRSNIPAISEFVFERVDPEFPARAREKGGGLIVGGENYGQGSSREHAALAPMALGVKAVIVKSFARIHKANLVNFGILPLVFVRPEDYESVAEGDGLSLPAGSSLAPGAELAVENRTRGGSFTVRLEASERDVALLKAGGLLNAMR